jgi:hypothetical protein
MLLLTLLKASVVLLRGGHVAALVSAFGTRVFVAVMAEATRWPTASLILKQKGQVPHNPYYRCSHIDPPSPAPLLRDL